MSAGQDPHCRYRQLLWRLGAWLGILGVAALVSIGSASVWLFNTGSGRDWALAQLRDHLPHGVHLDWEQAEGVLNGSFTLSNVTLQWGDHRIAVGALHWTLSLHPWTRTIDVTDLSLRAIDVQRAEDRTPFTLPNWPDFLPTVDVPFQLRVHHIAIAHLQFHQPQHAPITVDRVAGALSLGPRALRLERLGVHAMGMTAQLDGTYRPSLTQTTAVVGQLVMPAPPRGRPATLGIAARGTLAHMVVALAGDAPTRWHGMLDIRGRTAPTWTARLDGEQLAPALYAQQRGQPRQAWGDSVGLHLHASGRADWIRLHGTVRQGTQTVTLEPSTLQWSDNAVRINHLGLALLSGHLQLQGRIDLRAPARPNGHLTAVLRGMTLPPDQTGSAIVIDQAKFQLGGSLTGWRLTGGGGLSRAHQHTDLTWQVDGDQRHARCTRLTVTAGQGRLSLDGAVSWQPRLTWRAHVLLAQIDPGLLWPAWSGQLSGAIQTSGERRSAAALRGLHAYQMKIDDAQLQGRLRNRPVAARANIHWDGRHGEATLALHIGQSQLRAQAMLGDRLQLRVASQALALADLFPSGAGTVQGTFLAHGPIATPTLAVALHGQQLGWKSHTIDHLTVQGQLPWQGTGGHLAITARAISVGAFFDQLHIAIDGSLTRFTTQMALNAASVNATLHASLAAATPSRWQANLAALAIEPRHGERWQLSDPMTIDRSASRWRVSAGCLRAKGGELCLRAQYPGTGIILHSHGVSLALLNPWLPTQAGRPVTVHGLVRVDAQLQPDAMSQAWLGHLELASQEGGVGLGDSIYATLADNANHGNVIGYDNMTLTLDLSPAQIHAKLGIGFRGDGYVDATVTTGWSDDAPLQGQIYMYLARLYWLELLIPDMVKPTGTIAGHLSLYGTRAAPQFGGNLDCHDATVQLPMYGLSLRQGQGSLQAQPDGTIQLHASLQSAPGTAHIDGTLAWFDQPTPVALHVTGEAIQVYNTNNLSILADPDIWIAWSHDTIQLRGDVHIPRAVVDFARLDQTVTPSDDAIVMEAQSSAAATPATSPFDMDLHLHLGPMVKMHGLGFQGSIAGDIAILAQPRREMRASGQLDLLGRYKAYGQDLTVTQGQLRWNHNLITDPRITLHAERTIGYVKAGITVTGRAAYPHADVWSDPAMSQSEALSYIVLGHGLATATSNESQQVDAASSALSAGGGLIASQLGTKLGFDDAGISQSSTLGRSVLGVGKFISPRLYVGYGVSVVGSGSVINLKYLLEHGFDIEVESSTVETRTSINWRKER